MPNKPTREYIIVDTILLRHSTSCVHLHDGGEGNQLVAGRVAERRVPELYRSYARIRRDHLSSVQPHRAKPKATKTGP